MGNSDVRVSGRPGDAQDPGPAPSAGSEPRPRVRAQLVRFACVGVATTVLYTLLYLGLRDASGSAQVANAISLLLTALVNTFANRRITFGVRGSRDVAKHLVQGLIAFGGGLLLTAPALAVLHTVTATPARTTEVAVLIAANLLATALRFVLYRWWVFRSAQAQ
jgi:putative flippase GtrA